MKKPVHMSCALWLIFAISAPGVLTPQLVAQNKESKPSRSGEAGPKAPPAPKSTSPAKPSQGANRGEKIDRPVYPLDRWAAMNPAQREAAMAKMTPERRASLEKRLAHWESMPEAQKERVRNLTPAQRQILAAHAQWMQTLPQDRRQTIRRQIQMFEQISPEARQAELNSPSFGRKFDAEERDHIQKVVSTMPKE